MAIDLSSLSTNTTSAISLSNLILVTPEDAGIVAEIRGSEGQSVKKFLFDFYGEQTVQLKSDITDHYVEDNTALQDHIALQPEMITGHGFIGELKDFIPGLEKPVQTIQEKLLVISAYVPGLSASALLAYNQAFQLYQVATLAINSGVSTWGTINGNQNSIGNAVFSEVQNKQQLAFQMFYGYWKQRVLFTVQTPWAIFKHCALETLRAVQNAETRVITDFEVTFKPINFAVTQVTDINGNPVQMSGRANNQAQAGNPVNLGISAGTPYTGTDLLTSTYS